MPAHASFHDWVVKHAPPQVLQYLKRIYWRLLFQPEVEVLPLATLYRSPVEKHDHVEAEFVPMPDARELPMAPFAPHLHSGCYSVPEDFVSVLKGLLYCPVNAVVMAEPGKIVAESLCAGLSVKPFPRKQETVTGYCAPWRTPKDNYYHTLIDNLPRLLSLHNFSLGTTETIRLIYSGELSEAESFFVDTFCPPNVELTRLATDTLYRLENLIFTPFKTRRYAGYVPDRYASQIRNTLRPDRPGARKHRLFVSRTNATRRRIRNQAELVAALSRRGFETVTLETLPVEEQIELFYDAEMVVGAHGSGLANAMFADSLKLLELFPCGHVVPHYFYLSQSLGHTYAYWCGREDSHHDDFEVDVPVVLSILDGMAIASSSAKNVSMYSYPVHQRTSQPG